MRRTYNTPFSKLQLCVIVIGIIVIVIFLGLLKPKDFISTVDEHKVINLKSTRFVGAGKLILLSMGKVPYQEIEESVYNIFGYKTKAYKSPFSILQQIQPKTCAEVFLALTLLPWFISIS
ncbi:unnamed protein product [Enterobius vermicularis]|uniref:SLBB domain-containing protein n=1 Tax=Enterobius vermicularis TaxID=51028 RepID=A0A0N4VRJ2_ENTVE|nr:unnamed protein product [Enterobius vermicularis]